MEDFRSTMIETKSSWPFALDETDETSVHHWITLPWEQTTVLLSPSPLLTPGALKSEVISPQQVFQVPTRCWHMSSLVTKSCKISVANRFDDLRPDIWPKQGFVTQGQWGKLSFLLCDCGTLN